MHLTRRGGPPPRRGERAASSAAWGGFLAFGGVTLLSGGLTLALDHMWPVMVGVPAAVLAAFGWLFAHATYWARTLNRWERRLSDVPGDVAVDHEHRSIRIGGFPDTTDEPCRTGDETFDSRVAVRGDPLVVAALTPERRRDVERVVHHFGGVLDRGALELPLVHLPRRLPKDVANALIDSAIAIRRDLTRSEADTVNGAAHNAADTSAPLDARVLALRAVRARDPERADAVAADLRVAGSPTSLAVAHADRPAPGDLRAALTGLARDPAHAGLLEIVVTLGGHAELTALAAHFGGPTGPAVRRAHAALASRLGITPGDLSLAAVDGGLSVVESGAVSVDGVARPADDDTVPE